MQCQSFLIRLCDEILSNSKTCLPIKCTLNDSPFFLPIQVNTDIIRIKARDFAEAVQAEGIVLSSHYDYLVDNWNLNENITRTKLRTELNRLVEKGTILQKGQSFTNYSYKHL